jgi:hypothetical protein
MTQKNKQQTKRAVFIDTFPETINPILFGDVFSEKLVGYICYGQTGELISENGSFCTFNPDGSSYEIILFRDQVWTDEQGYKNGLSQ